MFLFFFFTALNNFNALPINLTFVDMLDMEVVKVN